MRPLQAYRRLVNDRLCGPVVRVPGYRSRGPGSIPAAISLGRGPLSLVSTIEELLERKSSGSGLEIREYGRRGSGALTMRHPSICKSWRSLSRYSLFFNTECYFGINGIGDHRRHHRGRTKCRLKEISLVQEIFLALVNANTYLFGL
jgi:hypothetical protein